MFTSAQSGHFLMLAAFAHNSYLLHDRKQRKKIQLKSVMDVMTVGSLR
jgi:hypothetical protein